MKRNRSNISKSGSMKSSNLSSQQRVALLSGFPPVGVSCANSNGYHAVTLVSSLTLNSPKDAVLRSKKMQDLLTEEIKARPMSHRDQDTTELDILSFVRAQGRAWRVTSGKEAIATMLHR